MQRRQFNALTTGVLASVMLNPWQHALAQGAAFKSGTDYMVLPKPLPTDVAKGKIEVLEFFWYNCPHCNAFEPAFAQWIKTAPKDVVVRRVPVAFRDDFAPQQRLFYALEAMNLLESLHAKVFAAIHAEKQALNTEVAIADWVAKQGVDKAKFLETYKSFGVASKLKRAVQLQNDFKVEGVPSFGVAGRYYTDGSIAGSMERALKVVESLIAQSRTRT